MSEHQVSFLVKDIPLVLAMAHCSNLAIGSNFRTSETNAITSSESVQEGSMVSWMLVQVKNATMHTPV